MPHCREGVNFLLVGFLVGKNWRSRIFPYSQRELVRTSPSHLMKKAVQKKKEVEEHKRSENIERERKCTSLVERIKQEDRQYLGDELYSVLREVNLTCKKLDGFKNTSIDSFIPYIKECRTQENIDINNTKKKRVSYLFVKKSVANK